MLDALREAPHVVGLKQSRKAVRDGAAACAYVAADAEERVRLPFLDLCRENGVPVYDVATMAALGQAAGIETGAAIAVALSKPRQ